MNPTLFAQVYDYENLYQAYLKARKQKRYRDQVLAFSYNLEEELLTLQNKLVWKQYQVGEYRQFEVWEPKQRTISALPFRDRVVQHAVSAVIEPIFERVMIADSFACRKGKGTLAAANRLSYFFGKQGTAYFLKGDVAKYFPSINQETLKGLVRRHMKDLDLLELLDQIISSASGAGLPIGNLLSQLFANVYLHQLDHFVKVTLGVKYYLRYMDDFLILGKSPEALGYLLRRIELFLKDELQLCLNAKTRIGRSSDGIEFVGYRIFRNNKIIRKASLCRMAKKFRAWKNGKVASSRFLQSIGSWAGHAKGTASHQFVETTLLKALKHSTNKGIA